MSGERRYIGTHHEKIAIVLGQLKTQDGSEMRPPPRYSIEITVHVQMPRHGIISCSCAYSNQIRRVGLSL